MAAITCGIDIGSTTTKVVLVDARAPERRLAWRIASTGPRAAETAERLLAEALAGAGAGRSDVARTFTTGYGRRLVDARDGVVSEITANAAGACAVVTPPPRTLLDVGGQDSKAVALGPDGGVVAFAMNDRCAAGTGRFLELVARILEVDLETLGRMERPGDGAPAISSLCAVFAETEIISLLARGAAPAAIAAGVHHSIARRLRPLLEEVGLEAPLAFDGGGARNPGLVEAVALEVGLRPRVPPEPQAVAAHGAAILAARSGSAGGAAVAGDGYQADSRGEGGMP